MMKKQLLNGGESFAFIDMSLEPVISDNATGL